MNSPVKKLNALLVTRTYYPDPNAAAIRLKTLSTSLENSGIDVTVITSTSVEEKKSTEKVKRLWAWRDKNGAIRGYIRYLSFDIPTFFRLLFRRSPSVYISEAPPTTGFVVKVIAFLKNKPYVYFAADIWATAAKGAGINGLVVKMLRAMEGNVLRKAKLVLSVSKDISVEIANFGVDAEKIITIGTGVDTDIFNTDGEKISLEYPYFIYPGTVSEFQGAEVFLKALAKLNNPNVRIYFFGQGTEKKMLENFAQNIAPGRVEFAGMVPPQEIAKWLRGAVAGLASIRPNIGYDFAIPTKSLVTIACGRPVIYAGPSPIAKEINENQLGIAVDWDADKVAEAFKEVLAGRLFDSNRLFEWVENNAAIGSAGRKAAESIKQMLESMP